MKQTSFESDAVEQLYAAAHERVVLSQGHSPTYFDNHVSFLANILRKTRDISEACHADDSREQTFDSSIQRALEQLQNLICRQERGRYLDCEATWTEALIRDVDPATFIRSQGTSSCFSWRGIPVLKSVFDVGVYMRLIEELRPATLLEIGSGVGGSALWFRDQLKALDIPCEIFSLDIHPPKLSVPGVSYRYGDANSLSAYLTPELVAHWPKPWLVIEDAHVAVTNVLLCVDAYLKEGDYLVVEDSEGKRTAMADFVSVVQGNYVIDSYFTDFFGINATSAADSILVRR